MFFNCSLHSTTKTFQYKTHFKLNRRRFRFLHHRFISTFSWEFSKAKSSGEFNSLFQFLPPFSSLYVFTISHHSRFSSSSYVCLQTSNNFPYRFHFFTFILIHNLWRREPFEKRIGFVIVYVAGWRRWRRDEEKYCVEW